MIKMECNKKILQRSQTKRAFIEFASRCFAEKGYAACSMDNIAQGAGLSKGGLYAHFKYPGFDFNNQFRIFDAAVRNILK